MSERPIQYEPHPVSRERKAELIAGGFRIIDAKFKPKDEPKPETLNYQALEDTTAPEKSVVELKAELTAKGIAFRANASRATLIGLLAKE